MIISTLATICAPQAEAIVYVMASQASELIQATVNSGQEAVAATFVTVTKVSATTLKVFVAKGAASKLTAMIYHALAFSVIGTGIALLLAFLFPGPITELLPPIALTLWWASYRINKSI